MPVISVVIPAFNAGRFINRTINSVLAQTYTDYEVIVVDDGSTDNTAEAVKSYGTKVQYIYQPNAGDGSARNTGINAAKGRWIAFLDHDDEWLPEKLDAQMKLLAANPDLRWCAGNFYNQSGGRKAPAVAPAAISKALSNNYSENYFTAVLRTGCNFMTSTMVIHREVFEQAGVFDSCWLRCADLDMWWRITYRFPKIGCLPQPLAILHVDVQDATSTRLRLLTKRGEETRKLIARHLKLAREHGMIEEFTPLAFSVLKKALLTTIFQGFGADSRAIVTQFKELFGWHWRIAVYLATIFPKATSGSAKAVAYTWHKLGLERDISRRWINSETIKSGNS